MYSRTTITGRGTLGLGRFQTWGFFMWWSSVMRLTVSFVLSELVDKCSCVYGS